MALALVLPLGLAACEALTRVATPAGPSAQPSGQAATPANATGSAAAAGGEAGEYALVESPNAVETAPTPGPFDAMPAVAAAKAGLLAEPFATGAWMLSQRVREFRARSFEEGGLAVRGAYYKDPDGDGLPEPGELGELWIGLEGDGPIQASAKSLDARMELVGSPPAAVSPNSLALAGPFKLKFSPTQEASTQVELVLTLAGPGGKSLTRTLPVPIEVPAKALVARRAWALPVQLGFSIALELHNPSGDIAPAARIRLANGNPRVLNVPALGPRQGIRLSPFLVSPTPGAEASGQRPFGFELELGSAPFRSFPVSLPAARK